MQNPIAVSVIIPIYNGESDLPDLLRSLYAQTYDRNSVEYLIIDNGSQDETWSALQQAEIHAQTDRFPLRILQESKIQGSYAARNQGICAAIAEILAFTDADCRPEPDWLTNLMQPFDVQPFDMQPLDATLSINSEANPNCRTNLGWVAGEVSALPSKNWLERYADRADTLSQKHTLANPFSPYGQTANLAVRKVCFTEVGLFRPYLTTGGDADQCWRILRETDRNWQFAANAVVRHRHRSTLKELMSQWQRYGRSNRFLHDLHGIELMKLPKISYYAYRLTRWLLKELPIALVKRNLLDALSTPVGLLCLRSRWRGQLNATLPDSAREIPPLTVPQAEYGEPQISSKPLR